MGIDIDKIITAFDLKQKKYSRLETILLEYGNLTQKFKDIEHQSWFFRKAEKNNLNKLIDFKIDFENIRSDINSSTIDDLIHAKNEQYNKILTIEKKKHINTIDMIALAFFNSNKNYIEEILEIKSRLNQIKEIDFYIENEEQLIELLGW